MQRFKNILVVSELESSGGGVLERAVALADHNQARLTIVEVVNEISSNTKRLIRDMSSEDLQAKMVSEHRKALKEHVAPWSEIVEIQTKVLIGIPFVETIRTVQRDKHDIVIKAAETDTFLERLFGSEDMHLLRKCPCPVWLFKPKSSGAYNKIVAAVDVGEFYSPEELSTRHTLNCQILEMAISLALSESAELHIVQSWEAVGEDSLRGFGRTSKEEVAAYVEEIKQQYEHKLDALLAQIVNNSGQNAIEYIEPKIHLLKGSPRNMISEFVAGIDADLVVMGTVARTGISGFFIGNTAETILNRITCSVLAIKPPGFETPVILKD